VEKRKIKLKCQDTSIKICRIEFLFQIYVYLTNKNNIKQERTLSTAGSKATETKILPYFWHRWILIIKTKIHLFFSTNFKNVGARRVLAL